MHRETPMVRAGIADRYPTAHRCRLPASLRGDSARQTPIPIDLGHQPIRSDDIGLELDDQQRSSRRVHGENIDRATLAVDRERRLGSDEPSRRHQLSTGRLLHGGVRGVEHAIELSTAPSRREIDPNIEGGGDTDKRAYGDGLVVATLDARDRCGGDTSTLGDIGLAHPAAQSKRPNDRSEANGIHPRIVRGVRLPAD